MDTTKLYKLIKETGYIQSVKLEREMQAYSTKEYQLTLVISTCPSYDGDKKIQIVFNNLSKLTLGNIDNFYKVFIEIMWSQSHWL